MPQSLVQFYTHIVFSTKNRRPLLGDPPKLDEMHLYLGGICTKLSCPLLKVGGVADHVHILCRLGKTIDISRLILELKKESSGWAKKELKIRDFYWQSGYGAFSVSPSHLDCLSHYIAHQHEHHRKVSFKEEFRRLCAKYGIEINERYVWD